MVIGAGNLDQSGRRQARSSMSAAISRGQDRRVLAAHHQGGRGDALEQRPAVGGTARAIARRVEAVEEAAVALGDALRGPGAPAARGSATVSRGSSRKLASAASSVSCRAGRDRPRRCMVWSRSAGIDGRLSMMTSALSPLRDARPRRPSRCGRPSSGRPGSSAPSPWRPPRRAGRPRSPRWRRRASGAHSLAP